MRITILYLGKTGGGCIYTYEMSRALIEEGADIQIIVPLLIENKQDFLNLTNNEHCEVLFVSTYNSKKEFLINSLKHSQFKKIAKEINSFGPECLYIPMITIWGRFVLPLINKNIQIVTTVHDVSQHLGEENFIIDKFNTYIIRHSNKIIILTKSFISEVAEKYHKPIANICWIRHPNYNYYRPTCFHEEKEIKKRLLFFGRIHEYKGVSVLLDAMEIIKHHIPEISMRIAGSGKISSENLNKIKLLSPSVEVVNKYIPNNEIYKYFEDVDIVVAPYIEASQSGVVMLAYAFNKPVIVSDVGGLPEQVFEDTGKIIPANDINALASTIIDFYRNPQTIINMRQAIKIKNNTIFSWQRAAVELLEFIDSQ